MKLELLGLDAGGQAPRANVKTRRSMEAGRASSAREFPLMPTGFRFRRGSWREICLGGDYVALRL